jgi:transposase
MIAEVTPDHPSQSAAINAVAQNLGNGTAEMLRTRAHRTEDDGGQRPRLKNEEDTEIKTLRREVPELRRTYEIPKAPPASSRPNSTGHISAREAHQRAQGPGRRRTSS